MSRNRATAKQRKHQQYRYGYRTSSQRKQGETAPFADQNKLEEDSKGIERYPPPEDDPPPSKPGKR